MKHRILVSLIAITLSTTLVACNKNDVDQNKVSINERNNETKDNIKTQDTVEAELKSIVSQSLNRYFDIDINKEDMDYSIKNESQKEADKITEEFDDLQEFYIEARPKNSDNQIIRVEMKYDTLSKNVEYINLEFKVENNTDKVSEEDVKIMAEKFLRDKALVSRETELRFDKIETTKDYIEVEFKYIIKNQDEEIKVFIDKRNNRVKGFDID
ncbi:hypothetical protein SAMN02745196_02257 [Clostridium collagenovorans DSM 3089]|uniref:Lipoprotein n=1 Tax=Clostridium collagenovorans DSM 3089 TaxID=1121306 RepID=A0A1M5XHH6_9CLOT|nr:hypothetical protein [Clostridium collagenovorans]SHH99271.1 hypothetical protein SAMN02745196_02257 [Clostridium collagenovorans DSM 3089]